MKSLIYLYLIWSLVIGLYIFESNYSKVQFQVDKFEMNHQGEMNSLEKANLAKFRVNILCISFVKAIKVGLSFPRLIYMMMYWEDQKTIDKKWNEILYLQKSEIYDHFNILKD